MTQSHISTVTASPEPRQGTGGASLGILKAWQPSTLSYVLVTLDSSGNVNVSSSGGGAGAVTIADGADVAQGHTTDIALPLNTYYWATAASAANVTPPPQEFAGLFVIPPGSMMALGGSAALTSATWGGLLAWMEIPI